MKRLSEMLRARLEKAALAPSTEFEKAMCKTMQAPQDGYDPYDHVGTQVVGDLIGMGTPLPWDIHLEQDLSWPE